MKTDLTIIDVANDVVLGCVVDDSFLGSQPLTVTIEPNAGETVITAQYFSEQPALVDGTIAEDVSLKLRGDFTASTSLRSNPKVILSVD